MSDANAEMGNCVWTIARIETKGRARLRTEAAARKRPLLHSGKHLQRANRRLEEVFATGRGHKMRHVDVGRCTLEGGTEHCTRSLRDDGIGAIRLLREVDVVYPCALHELELVMDAPLVAEKQQPSVVRIAGPMLLCAERRPERSSIRNPAPKQSPRLRKTLLQLTVRIGRAVRV